MPQAIVTRYHGPTARLNGRYSATARAGRVYVPAESPGDDSALAGLGGGWAGYIERAHARAALALCQSLGWNGTLTGGHLPQSDGGGDLMAWVWGGQDGGPVLHVAPAGEAKP